MTEREALELALEALETLDRVVLGTRRAEEAITAIKEALAQPSVSVEQEPVAIYQYQMGNGSWIDQDQGSYRYNKQHGHTVRIVYTTPPQRKPLTDEQIEAAVKAWFENDIVAGQRPFSKRMRAAIEVAHGIYAPPELKE